MSDHQAIYHEAKAHATPQQINRARLVFGKLEKACSTHATRSMEIGYSARIMEDENLYSLVGFKDKKDCIQALKIGRSTYYRVWRIASGYPNLDEETFINMTAENAELLLRIDDESQRQSEFWITAASSDTETEFEKKVLEYLSEKTDTPVQEQRVPFKMGMLEGQRTVINDGIEAFQREHGLDNPARALELMVVETTGRKTLVGYLVDSLPKLRTALDLVSDDVDAESALPRMKEILEDYILGLAQSLEVNG